MLPQSSAPSALPRAANPEAPRLHGRGAPARRRRAHRLRPANQRRPPGSRPGQTPAPMPRLPYKPPCLTTYNSGHPTPPLPAPGAPARRPCSAPPARDVRELYVVRHAQPTASPAASAPTPAPGAPARRPASAPPPRPRALPRAPARGPCPPPRPAAPAAAAIRPRCQPQPLAP